MAKYACGHFLIWFVELEKFKRDFILISLCFLIFLFLFTFFCLFGGEKNWRKVVSIFLIYCFLALLSLCVFVELKKLKSNCPQFS
jgi:hypothetical protein